MLINYVTGDVTLPQGEGKILIPHCCNDAGKWGAGFTAALDRRWTQPREHYQLWSTNPWPDRVPFDLGQVIYSTVVAGDKIVVANIIGQHGVKGIKNPLPIRYYALQQGLISVARVALTSGFSVHMPRIGCGLAGGDWNIIERIIREELVDRGLDVTVYNFVK